jgi:glycosyltransferase 2 family protein
VTGPRVDSPGTDDAPLRTTGADAQLATAARVGVSALLLVVIGRFLDLGDVLEKLRDLSVGWVLLGLGISTLQVALLAWRWSFTAERLGIRLSLSQAWREYYVSLFLNQVLPGGVGGDVARAWRHARTSAPAGPSVRAVILERASGQIVMTLVACVSLIVLFVPSMGSATSWGSFGLIGVIALVGFGTVIASHRSLRSLAMSESTPDDPGGRSLPSRVGADVYRSVLSRDALPFQMISAAILVASFIAVYLVAARAIGVDTDVLRLLPLIAPVLMTMLIPVSIAGWGVREGAAAALWGMVGLTPEDGVAISVAYGLLILVSSAPGAFVLLLHRGRSETQ